MDAGMNADSGSQPSNMSDECAGATVWSQEHRSTGTRKASGAVVLNKAFSTDGASQGGSAHVPYSRNQSDAQNQQNLSNQQGQASLRPMPPPLVAKSGSYRASKQQGNSFVRQLSRGGGGGGKTTPRKPDPAARRTDIGNGGDNWEASTTDHEIAGSLGQSGHTENAENTGNAGLTASQAGGGATPKEVGGGGKQSALRRLRRSLSFS